MLHSIVASTWWLLEQLLLLVRLHHGNVALHVEVLLAVDDVMSCCLEGAICAGLEGLPVVAVWHARLSMLVALREAHGRGTSDRAIQIRLFCIVQIRPRVQLWQTNQT